MVYIQLQSIRWIASSSSEVVWRRIDTGELLLLAAGSGYWAVGLILNILSFGVLGKSHV